MTTPASRPLPYRLPTAPASASEPPHLLSAARRTAAGIAALGDLELCGVTRMSEDVWTVLAAAAPRPGTVVPPLPPASWSDSLCSRMWEGLGPRLAPDVLAVPAYADAPHRSRYAIRTYVGAPIVDPDDGQLFGTLCGIASEPMSEHRAEAVGSHLRLLVEAHAAQLGHEVVRERRRLADARENDWLTACGTRDELTGVPSRLGWRMLLGREEVRARELSEPLGVLVVDVDGARSVRSLRRAATVLVAACACARVTRIGPKRFAVLCAGWRASEVAALRATVADALTGARLVPTTAWAMRRHPELSAGTTRSGAEGAWRSAEFSLLTAHRGAA